MGAFETHAEALIDRGYAAFRSCPAVKFPASFAPACGCCCPRGNKRYLDGRKPQLHGPGGLGLRRYRPRRRWWPASHGLIGVDIDTDDAAIQEAIVKVLPPTPVTKIGHKGETRLFHGPDIVSSCSWSIGGKRVCDLIGPGRQTVLPPTIHPVTGAPYRWQGAELERYRPEDLPLLTPDDVANIGAALVPFGWRPDSSYGKATTAVTANAMALLEWNSVLMPTRHIANSIILR